MKKLIIPLLVITLLSGCITDREMFKVEGVITSVQCNANASESRITLDNNVQYIISSSVACKISEGIKITLIHSDKLYVKEYIIEGTEKVNE